MGELKKPSQTMDYQSQDRNFSVSWLLGLRPYPTRPSWAHLYETEERYFRVSRILGLIPSRKPRKSRRTRKTSETVHSTSDETVKEEPDFGLRRLFRDGSEDDDVDEDSEGNDTDTSNDSDSDPPVLAEPAFLEFCKELEELLEDIE